MYLMANKAVPGSSEHVLYLTAALPTFPGPTQMLLEVRLEPSWRHRVSGHTTRALSQHSPCSSGRAMRYGGTGTPHSHPGTQVLY